MTLFNRVKSCTVKEIENDLFEARGTFIDTYHELNLLLQVKIADLEIVSAAADLVRLPQKYCPQVQGREQYLVGIKIGRGLIKAIGEAVGGIHGCVHLADLTLDLAKAIVVTKNKLAEVGLTKEEIDDHHGALFSGTCYHWTEMGKKK